MLIGLYRNMPIFLDDYLLILDHKVNFGSVLYLSSVLIYKNCPLGPRHMNHQLSCQWSVGQQGTVAPASLIDVKQKGS